MAPTFNNVSFFGRFQAIPPTPEKCGHRQDAMQCYFCKCQKLQQQNQQQKTVAKKVRKVKSSPIKKKVASSVHTKTKVWKVSNFRPTPKSTWNEYANIQFTPTISPSPTKYKTNVPVQPEMKSKSIVKGHYEVIHKKSVVPNFANFGYRPFGFEANSDRC